MARVSGTLIKVQSFKSNIDIQVILDEVDCETQSGIFPQSSSEQA